MLSFFYRAEKVFCSVVHTNSSFSSMSARLFASRRKTFACLASSFFPPAAGKDAEIVGRHNFDFPQLGGRSVDQADGPQPALACCSGACRAAGSRKPRENRTFVSGSGVTLLWKSDPQAPPRSNLAFFFCVCVCLQVPRGIIGVYTGSQEAAKYRQCHWCLSFLYK